MRPPIAALLVTACITQNPAFDGQAGTHGDAVCMRYDDYASLARPVVGSFAMRPCC